MAMIYNVLFKQIYAWSPAALWCRPWPASPAKTTRLDPGSLIEEERTPYYRPDRFFPARLGQILHGRYQLATKLGFGSGSTVWLARDLWSWRWTEESYVAIKINAVLKRTAGQRARTELEQLHHISKHQPSHAGSRFVRRLLDSFEVVGDAGKHDCLVFEPLREPLWLYCSRFVDKVIPPEIFKVQLQMILEGLDFLHSNCHIVHSDLKPDNIMVKVEDLSILKRDASDEYAHPLPQKEVDGRIIYLSRNNYGHLRKPDGIIQIVDFDQSVSGEHPNSGCIQAEIYRAPEVMLDAGYSYAADIWSLGVLMWDVLEGTRLFQDAWSIENSEHDEQLHFDCIAALIGPPPAELVTRGKRKDRFYAQDGSRTITTKISSSFNFDTCIKSMHGKEKRLFIQFVKRMLTWLPEERSTAKELLSDPWLHTDFAQDKLS